MEVGWKHRLWEVREREVENTWDFWDDKHRFGRREPRGRAREERRERIDGGEREKRNNKNKGSDIIILHRWTATVTLPLWRATVAFKNCGEPPQRLLEHHFCGLALLWKNNCLRKIKEEKKRLNTQIKNTRIYVVWQYAYIHGRRQGESFIKKIGRLQ